MSVRQNGSIIKFSFQASQLFQKLGWKQYKHIINGIINHGQSSRSHGNKNNPGRNFSIVFIKNEFTAYINHYKTKTYIQSNTFDMDLTAP